MIRVKKLKTIKAAIQHSRASRKKTAAAKAQPKHDSVTVPGLGENPLIAATRSKPSRKPAGKSRKAMAATLGANDKLPEGIVTRMWQAGKSLTEIAQNIGTGTRPQRHMLPDWPHLRSAGEGRAVSAQGKELTRGFLRYVCFSCGSKLQRWGQSCLDS